MNKHETKKSHQENCYSISTLQVSTEDIVVQWPTYLSATELQCLKSLAFLTNFKPTTFNQNIYGTNSYT